MGVRESARCGVQYSNTPFLFFMKALSLLSGGLDSMLTARLILDQGIDVDGIGFFTPFFSSDRGRIAADRLGIPFYPFDITGEFIRILQKPRYGYGRNCNPCTDCHRLMVATAAGKLEERGAAFIITGEVLGQRPKSQTRDALNAVAKGAGRGLLLRPLSALLLEETIPEKKGWVDRSRLLGLSGRSRKEQLALAARYGLEGYSTPAGGCLLTEEHYCRRLKELKEREGWNAADLELLRVGRHFRLPSGAKVISGRDEGENLRLEQLAADGDLLLQAADKPGSLILLRAPGGSSPGDLELAAAVCARYSKEKGRPSLEIACRKKAGMEKKLFFASPLPDDVLEEIRI
ncbi:MAG: tRNA 4-thiouridine(8) synthase ThiI [PVC group bacterium]